MESSFVEFRRDKKVIIEFFIAPKTFKQFRTQFETNKWLNLVQWYDIEEEIEKFLRGEKSMDGVVEFDCSIKYEDIEKCPLKVPNMSNLKYIQISIKSCAESLSEKSTINKPSGAVKKQNINTFAVKNKDKGKRIDKTTKDPIEEFFQLNPPKSSKTLKKNEKNPTLQSRGATETKETEVTKQDQIDPIDSFFRKPPTAVKKQPSPHHAAICNNSFEFEELQRAISGMQDEKLQGAISAMQEKYKVLLAKEDELQKQKSERKNYLVNLETLSCQEFTEEKLDQLVKSFVSILKPRIVRYRAVSYCN